MNNIQKPRHAQMDRIRYIYAKLNSERGFSTNELMQDMEVSWRTAMRDIEYLRERCEIPFIYDKQSRRYVLNGKTEGISFFEIDGYHLGLLRLMIQHFESVIGDSMEKSLALISNTLKQLVRSDSLYAAEDLDDKIMVCKWRNQNLLEEDVWILLSRALREDRVTSFTDGGGKRQNVEPYRLAFIEGLAYLIFRNPQSDSMSMVGLSELCQFELSKKTFERDDLLLIEEMVDRLLVLAGDKKAALVVPTFPPVPCSELTGDSIFLNTGNE